MFTCCKFILFSLVLLNTPLGSAYNEPHVVHEQREDSEEWHKSDRVDPDAYIRLRIALTQTNLDQGHDLLMDMSHPASQNYGKHYSMNDIVSLFSPTEETISNVIEWLVSSGIDKKRITHVDNKGWLVFDARTHEAEKLLKTQYYMFEHAETGSFGIAGDNYSIPKRIQKHVEFVTPGVLLRPPAKSHSAKRKLNPHGTKVPEDQLADCKKLLTPACVMRLYGIPFPTYKHPHPNNSLAVYSPAAGVDPYDLNRFFTSFAPWVPNGTVPVDYPINLNGKGVASKFRGHANGESLMDIDMALPIIYPQNVSIFTEDDRNAYEVFNDYYDQGKPSLGELNHFLDAIDGTYCTLCKFGECGDDPKWDVPVPNKGFQRKPKCGVYNPPNVVSISWGFREWQLPVYYQRRQCFEFMKLALRGVSAVVACGDYHMGKLTEIITECGGEKPAHFVSYYPSSCPYVTNVAGTRLSSRDGIGIPERMVFFTSGGWSNIFARPDYQNSAIESYFTNYDPGYPYYQSLNGSYGLGYNRIGRAMTDLSAISEHFPVYGYFPNEGDRYSIAGGVSMAAPLVAGILTRINEERLAVGKNPVGFVNPAIYHHPEMLNDIVEGWAPTNRSCLDLANPNHPPDQVWGKAFRAVPGWDPGTGMGSPNYPLMLDYFMSLP